MDKEDIIQNRPIYSQEQIDQLALTPDGKATLMIKKKPRMVKKPVYLLDDKGEKVPLNDEDGNIIIDENGVIQYIIKDFVEEQQGWEAFEEIAPATETNTIDTSTGNVSAKGVEFLTKSYWRYNYFLVYQTETNEDYSVYLHKLRNDILGVLNASKSYNQGTIQAVKTFINKVHSQEFIDTPQEQKTGFLDKLFGSKKPARKAPEHKAAFT